MGAGLGWALRMGGARVVVTVEGRSARTRRLAEQAALELRPGVTDVIALADVVLSVTPPDQALAAAQQIAATALADGDPESASDLSPAEIVARLGR